MTARIFAAVGILLGLDALYAHIFGFAIDIALWSLVGTVSEASVIRMTPHSAVVLIFVALSALFVDRHGLAGKISETSAVMALFATLAALLGHLYGANQLYSFNAQTMTVGATFLFGGVTLAVLAGNTNGRVVALLTDRSLGGEAARRLLPVAILIPPMIGWIRMIGQEHGLYDTGFGVALNIWLTISLMTASIYYFSRMLRVLDLRRKAAEIELAEKSRRYETVVQHGLGIIWTHDADGVITSINPAGASILGYPESEIIGRNFIDIVPPDRHADFRAYLRLINNNGIASGDLTVLSSIGLKTTIRYHNLLIDEGIGDPYILCHGQDVTELLQAQTELKEMSFTDDLTGLNNRRGFLAIASKQVELEKHSRTARGLSLIFADMDGLKYINDNYGHDAGSKAIATVADLLRDSVRGSDIVGRWGGDEFVIVSIGTDDDSSRLLVQRLEEKLQEYNAGRDTPYEISLSIGVARGELDGTMPLEDVIAQADDQMYIEKRRRRGARGGAPNSAVHAQLHSDPPVRAVKT